MSNYTMAIIVNSALKMSAGKVAAQAAHGAVQAALTAQGIRSEVLEQWLQQGGRKICLQTDSLDILESVQLNASKSRIQSVEIRDAGLTEIPAGSLTVVVLGPGSKRKIKKLTSQLRLY
jgi:PTH2 family peptidyl-tRNA hydrolase|tara:strand:+ start:177 stop:533 length:357 start_codon:yes stop_codon:yes gene_type:complete